MGACASIPKVMKGDAGGAPAPEPAKEDFATANAAGESVEEKAVDREAKAEGGDHHGNAEDEKTLGTFLTEANGNEEAKESSEITEKVDDKTPGTETGEPLNSELEQKSEPLPAAKVADDEKKPTEDGDKVAHVAPPIARATTTTAEEEKEITKEAKEEK